MDRYITLDNLKRFRENLNNIIPNIEGLGKYEISGIVDGVTVESAGVDLKDALPGVYDIVFDKSIDSFLLRLKGESPKYYLAWNNSSLPYLADNTTWLNYLTQKNNFYVNNEDGTTAEYYSDGDTLRPLIDPSIADQLAELNSKIKTIKLDELDTDITSREDAISKMKEICKYFVISEDIIVGEMFYIGDNSSHGLTQIFTTNLLLQDNGAFSGHTHTHLYTYHRLYVTYPTGFSGTPMGTWTNWSMAQPIDNELKDDSTNAVQNKVISENLNSITDTMGTHDDRITAVENRTTDDFIKTLVLRQLYTSAGATYNPTSGFYELNGVKDIDEEEMSGIYVESLNIRVAANSYAGYPYRTTLKLHAAGQNDNLQNVFSSKYLISLGKTVSNYIAETPSLYGAFNNSNNIRIASNKSFYSVNVYGSAPFGNAKELVQVLLRNNKTGFTIKDSLRISYYSLNYLATNASGTAFTVTLPTGQANILDMFAQKAAAGNLYTNEAGDLNVTMTFPTPGEITTLSGLIAALPWEAKLKIPYTAPIWKEDNGSTIEFTNKYVTGSSSETLSDIAYSDARPNLIKHEKGLDDNYIYDSWVSYVNSKLDEDGDQVDDPVHQYTTAINNNFATSLNDWYQLYKKFAEKNITVTSVTS